MEKNLTKYLPYEIHVTIKSTKDIEYFKKICQELEVKPIILDLQVMSDYMTSSVFMGNNGEAIREVERISKGLKDKGFDVLREKVETVPWHPAAPREKDQHPIMPDNCYFECHLAVKLHENQQEELENLIQDVGKEGMRLHKSRNIFKKYIDGQITQMLTYRLYDKTYEEFKANIQILEQKIKTIFNLDKIIIEFSVYDTKISHDQKWVDLK